MEKGESEEKRSVRSPMLIFITESEQSLPQGKNWSAFLGNGENKTEQIRFLIKYYKSQAVRCIFHPSCSYIPLCNIIWLMSNVIWVIAVYMYLYTFTSNLFCTYYRSKLRIPLVITEICNTWLVSPEDATLLETCNHHEADTRIVSHVSLSDKPLVIVAADTYIFVLLIYAFHKSHPSEKWFVKIEKNRYLDIGDIFKTYGEGICDALLVITVLQGMTLLHIHTRLEKWNHSRKW